MNNLKICIILQNFSHEYLISFDYEINFLMVQNVNCKKTNKKYLKLAETVAVARNIGRTG